MSNYICGQCNIVFSDYQSYCNHQHHSSNSLSNYGQGGLSQMGYETNKNLLSEILETLKRIEYKLNEKKD